MNNIKELTANKNTIIHLEVLQQLQYLQKVNVSYNKILDCSPLQFKNQHLDFKTNNQSKPKPKLILISKRMKNIFILEVAVQRINMLNKSNKAKQYKIQLQVKEIIQNTVYKQVQTTGQIAIAIQNLFSVNTM
ncbi:Hypothetical_protein [Hexamita inflata]|uniref:Hypothetical_protein n=1 Tax=Hexamita inflata TaxID=28002 RepID=A0AA86QCN9_9EUKA|nr:Hypothetical protein HINF_LOCUS43970 [Hexamita inflata]